MAKNKKRRRPAPKTCDPNLCDHCMYIGDGDFVCDLHGLGAGGNRLCAGGLGAHGELPAMPPGRCCEMTPKPWENGEGYPDPTAYNALRPIMQEDAALEGKVNFLIKVLKFIIAESGFELLARIEIKD